MDKLLFKWHRENLLKQLLPNSVAIFFAGKEIKSTADQLFPFMINKNFYYLTGIKQTESILMLIKGANSSEIFLFIQEYDEYKEKWTGKKLTPSEAKEISGVENISPLHNFPVKLKLALSSSSEHFGTIEHLYLDLEKDLIIEDKLLTTLDFKKKLRHKYKDITIHDSFEIMKKLRLIKDNEEIMALKEAISVTNEGLKKIATSPLVGLYEYHAVHEFAYEIGRRGNHDLAFPTIAASGVNATILHYPDAKDILKSGDLLLLDLGAKGAALYGADITRTYPISGKFSMQQRKIYEIVLQCNLAIIERAKPGATLLELQEFAVTFLAGKCFSLGLIAKKEDITKHFYHGVSHFLGLDVHDVGDKNILLQAGMVITVEPGLYFKDLGIGIRIEDDVLITKDGCQVLSSDIVKNIDDVEKLMRQGN